jgi:hypothetical protein
MPILVKEENDRTDDFYKRITNTRDRLFLTKSDAEIRREAETKRRREEMYKNLIKNGKSHADAMKVLGAL